MTEHVWDLVYRQLDEFLAAWEAACRDDPEGNPHYRVRVDQRLDLRYLLRAWPRRHEADASADYRHAVRAYLVTDPAGQRRFDQAWDEFWASDERLESPARTAARSGVQAVAGRPAAPVWWQAAMARWWRRLVAAVVLVVVAGLVGALQLRQATEPVLTQTATPPPEVASAPVAPAPTEGTSLPGHLAGAPLRPNPPVIAFSSADRVALRHLVLAWWWPSTAAIALVLGLVGWRLRQLRFELGGRANDALEARVAPARFRPLFLPRLGRRIAKLKFSEAPSRRIDPARTALASARSAVAPVTVHRSRRREMEYVLVADSRAEHDQSTWWVRRLRDELARARLNVAYYEYDRSPAFLWPRGEREQEMVRFEQLATRHPLARLLLVADRDILFYRLSGGVQRWLQSVRGWEQHVLVLHESLETSEHEALDAEGFRVHVLAGAPNLSATLDALARKDLDELVPGRSPGAPAAERDGPPDAIVGRLRGRLGPGPMVLLGAMAMYPRLDNELTRTLYDVVVEGPHGQTLGPADLLTVQNLGWCRDGWFPSALRRALLDDLSAQTPSEYARLRAFYQVLFASSDDSVDALRLRFAPPPAATLAGMVRRAHLGAGATDPLGDAIFARVLLFPSWRKELRLREWLAGAVPREARAKVGAALGLLCLAGLLAAASHGLWAFWGEERFAQRIVRDRVSTHARTTVTLRLHPRARALRDPLDRGFRAMNFQTRWVEDEDVTENRVLAPAEVSATLAAIAEHMAWGERFDVFDASVSEVQVAALPSIGAVFEDRLRGARDYRPDGYPKPRAWQDPAPVPAPVPVPVPTLSPLAPDMVQIPAGRFVMGSPDNELGRFSNEGPVREVQVPAFELGRYEVTFEQWDRCAADGACVRPEDEGWGRGRRPVINVSWNQVQDYIAWLNAQLQLTGRNAYRLPSEAQWEYAARAGTTTAYHWGEGSQCEHANGADAALVKEYGEVSGTAECDDSYVHTAPVGKFDPNAFGLHDMSGNVWEWVQDCYRDSYAGAPTDGSAVEADGCKLRSLRGGGWVNGPRYLRSASRDWDGPGERDSIVGFRLARTR